MAKYARQDSCYEKLVQDLESYLSERGISLEATQNCMVIRFKDGKAFGIRDKEYGRDGGSTSLPRSTDSEGLFLLGDD